MKKVSGFSVLLLFVFSVAAVGCALGPTKAAKKTSTVPTPIPTANLDAWPMGR